jgi:hypothetical protein
MSKLLITGGCSNSDPRYWAYPKNGVMVWPEIIANDNGWDLINLATAGSSNDDIENKVYDTVLENIDKDLVVMVFWTEPCRVNVWGNNHFQLHSEKKRYTEYSHLDQVYKNVDTEKFAKHFDDLDNFSYPAWLKYREYLGNKHEKETMDSFYKITFLMQDILKKFLNQLAPNEEFYDDIDKSMLDHSLRSISRLGKFLKTNNIENYFKCSLSLVDSIPLSYPYWRDEMTEFDMFQKAEILKRHNKLFEYCTDHPVFKEFNISGLEWNEGFCRKEHNHMLLECGHPNREGMEKIAKEFMELYNG